MNATLSTVADMVLLDANPLLDIANTRLIRGVMIRGEWWTRQMIDAELAAIQREYAEDAARLRHLGLSRPASDERGGPHGPPR